MTLLGLRRIERFGLALMVAPLVWQFWFVGELTQWHGYAAVSFVGALVWGSGVLLARRRRATLEPEQALAETTAAESDAHRHPDGLTSRSERSPLVVAGLGVIVVFGGLALLVWLLS